MTTDHGPGDGRPDPGLDAVISERHRLVNLAYRLLGSLTEAEDAVQETYARWYTVPLQQRDAIYSPGAWLTTVTSRICINMLRSARARRETCTGAWLPEPLPDPAEWISGRPAAAADPADRITLDESVSMAFLVVLESLTPAERVALILHDVFGYPFTDIAEITGRTPAACRQLATSARRRVHVAQPPATATAQQASIITDFRHALEAGDISAIIGLLDPAATVTGDIGLAPAALSGPLHGAEQIARTCLAVISQAPGLTLLERTVNGQPGLVAQQDGVTTAVYAFETAGNRITHIWAILDPGKLRSWTTH
jgi:RNA polymerase sigma factor (sigma-70 family)